MNIQFPEWVIKDNELLQYMAFRVPKHIANRIFKVCENASIQSREDFDKAYKEKTFFKYRNFGKLCETAVAGFFGAELPNRRIYLGVLFKSSREMGLPFIYKFASDIYQYKTWRDYRVKAYKVDPIKDFACFELTYSTTDWHETKKMFSAIMQISMEIQSWRGGNKTCLIGVPEINRLV